ncbi:MAG: aldo/keto reductase [Solobacterium sp.]|nr:aldo/keto reductase [Solobacterium sp.]
MKYRRLGKTDLMVSEIGFGGEWMERHNAQEVEEVIRTCEEEGINILDCWMAEPNVRTNIGKAIHNTRDKWYIQGHIGSTWQNGQYVRTRDMEKVVPAFEDLLERLQTDYIDLGMIHFVDSMKEYDEIVTGPFLQYVKELKETGRIQHIGMSSHNPAVAARAVREGLIENLLFSINPAFDLMSSGDDILDRMFGEHVEMNQRIDPARAELYRLCEENDVGITVMKGYGGGRLFDAKRSPFGIALTPVQCIHYILTRPAVASVMAGYDTPEHVRDAVAYETATDEEKDFASVLAKAPLHRYGNECTYCGHCRPCPVNIDIAMVNKYYDLASMQEEVPESIRAHYMALDVHASACIQCRSCESRCPFGVPVAERMQKTAELFGE